MDNSGLFFDLESVGLIFPLRITNSARSSVPIGEVFLTGIVAAAEWKKEFIMLEKITELLVDQLGVDAADVDGDTSFKDDLGADSLDLFEMVMNLEEEYGIEVPAEELENIVTVNDMIEYLESKGITE